MKTSFWKTSGILKALVPLAFIVALTGCDDVLTRLKDEIKLGQQTKQEKLDFSLVLENTEPEARYSAVIYGTDGAPVAGAEGTPLADDSVVFAFLVLPGEYDLKITEKAGAAKTTKTDSVVFVDGLPKVIIGWDGLLEADAAEEPVSDEDEAVEETDTEEEAVAEEPEAVEETDTEEEAVTDEPEAVEETDTEEEAVAEEPEEEPKDEPKAEEPEAVEETDTEEEAVEEEPEEARVRFGLNPDTTYHFPAVEVGYGPQTPVTFTVRNKGNQPTGDLSVDLLDNAVLVDNGIASFVLSTDTIPSIPVGGTATFTVVPRVGLDAGIYSTGKGHTASIVVRSRSATGSILWNMFSHVSFTVLPAGSLSK
jgi:hypothetical protein